MANFRLAPKGPAKKQKLSKWVFRATPTMHIDTPSILHTLPAARASDVDYTYRWLTFPYLSPTICLDSTILKISDFRCFAVFSVLPGFGMAIYSELRQSAGRKSMGLSWLPSSLADPT